MGEIPLIVIGGATASGKTALSIELAKEYNAEIKASDGTIIDWEIDLD